MIGDVSHQASSACPPARRRAAAPSIDRLALALADSMVRAFGRFRSAKAETDVEDQPSCPRAVVVRLASPRTTRREFVGTLVRLPKVGEPLWLHLGDDCQLITSTIRRIDEKRERVMVVETRNSRYRVWVRPC